MNPNPDKLRIEWLAARNLEAFEADDFDTQARLWKLAEIDPALRTAFEEVHADLLEEQQRTELLGISNEIASAVESHLPSAEAVDPPTGPVTVADVAKELFEHPPSQLPASAHAVNESLLQSTEPLPTNLGLLELIAWAETRFGTAPAEFWKAFREAAHKVRMRTNAEIEFQLAARRTRPPTEGQS
jgi:hypothetical protein